MLRRPRAPYSVIRMERYVCWVLVYSHGDAGNIRMKKNKKGKKLTPEEIIASLLRGGYRETPKPDCRCSQCHKIDSKRYRYFEKKEGKAVWYHRVDTIEGALDNIKK